MCTKWSEFENTSSLMKLDRPKPNYDSLSLMKLSTAPSFSPVSCNTFSRWSPRGLPSSFSFPITSFLSPAIVPRSPHIFHSRAEMGPSLSLSHFGMYALAHSLLLFLAPLCVDITALQGYFITSQAFQCCCNSITMTDMRPSMRSMRRDITPALQIRYRSTYRHIIIDEAWP